jgi:hypothetical protein
MMRLLIMSTWLFAMAASSLHADQNITHRLLIADDSTRRVAIVAADGSIEWEHKIGSIHDLHLLSSGNVLCQLSWTQIVEIDPRTDKIVWDYDAAKRNGNEGKRLEVHAFQRLANGNTMIAESGIGRIIEVDNKGKIVHQIALKIGTPSVHSDTRIARKLANGNYLVCHESQGVVREYDGAGKVVWDYAVPLFGKQPRPGHGPEAFGNSVFSAVRLTSGNTLLSTGNGHGILEVTPAKQIVWSLKQNDLPNIVLAWVTTLQVLPNGNIVFGNCHAGPNNPQVIEITRDKRVVWTFRDFNKFGNSAPTSEVLDVAGTILR